MCLFEFSVKILSISVNMIVFKQNEGDLEIFKILPMIKKLLLPHYSAHYIEQVLLIKFYLIRNTLYISSSNNCKTIYRYSTYLILCYFILVIRKNTLSQVTNLVLFLIMRTAKVKIH